MAGRDRDGENSVSALDLFIRNHRDGHRVIQDPPSGYRSRTPSQSIDNTPVSQVLVVALPLV